MSRVFLNEVEPDRPFLSLQSHSLSLQRSRANLVDLYLDEGSLFKKPDEMCLPIGDALPSMMRNKMKFSRDLRAHIEDYVHAYGLKIRKMKPEDTEGVIKFMNERYPPEHAIEICAFDLYRWREYGHGIILEDVNGDIQGTVFEVGYDTLESTSYTIRLAVSEKLKGRALGFNIMLYSSLTAMEQGSRVKRGIIRADNFRSLYINLNRVGWLIDGFEMGIPGLGEHPFYKIVMSLDPLGLVGNKVDMDRAVAFVKNHNEKKDYILIDPNNYKEIYHIYKYTTFRIVAFIHEGKVKEHACLLALPLANLCYTPNVLSDVS